MIGERSNLEWAPGWRVAFRFAALYFGLYSLTSLPLPLGAIPIERLWTPVLAWIAERVLGFEGPISIRFSGSGDRLVDYVEVLTFVVLAGVGTLVWSVVDRERRSYPRLAAALTIWARYWLASFMLAYGVIKLLLLQFPYPDVVTLSATYGESTPMQVLWTSVGISPLYNRFAGGVEVLAGLLLFTRRTSTLGALLSVGAMANIVALDFGYDVPVKLFSTQLLLLSLILAALDGRRLLAVFVQNRPVPARELGEPRRAWQVVAGIYVAANLALLGWYGLEQRSYVDAGEAPLSGLYEVVSHERDGEPLTDDSQRWRQIAVGRGRLAIDPLHGSRSLFDRLEVDLAAQTLSASGRDGVVELRYEWLDDGNLAVEGTVGDVEHRAEMRVVDEQALPLVDHGFHWIQE